MYKNRSDPLTEEEKSSPEKTATITLYQNGFQVNDEPFRSYEGDENKKFMKELNDGVVPTELRSKYQNGLSVNLKDSRSQAYRPPTPPSYVAFSGQGQSLGGTNPV